MKYDCIIIGGGVVGLAVLDKLAKFKISSLLLERSNDVASGASKANSGIVHAGYDCEPNSLKAIFNVKGNELMWKVASELDVPCINCGSIVVGRKEQYSLLEKLYQNGKSNGVDVKILNREQTLDIEPNIADEIEYSLYAKDAGVVSPYKLTIAFADRAITNGAEIKTNSEVLKITKIDDGYEIVASKNTYYCKSIVNCAGASGVYINEIAGAEKFECEFRRGDYLILDSTERKNISTVIFPLPTVAGKGILIAPTSDGNVIYGPTSIQVDRAHNSSTEGIDKNVIYGHKSILTDISFNSSTLEGLDDIKKNVPLSYKLSNYGKCIRVYSGVRVIIGHDFVIEKSKIIDNFYMAVGICSPGLSSAPYIGEYLGDMIAKDLGATIKDSFVTKMKKHLKFTQLKAEEINQLISTDKRWGKMVCRCEKVTEAEIVNAIHSPLLATSLDAIKRRTRAGMGRCQGGFCTSRVMQILSRELNIPINEVVKSEIGSQICKYRIKEVDND